MNQQSQFLPQDDLEFFLNGLNLTAKYITAAAKITNTIIN